MLGIVFLAAILGVTNVIDRSGTNGRAMVEDISKKGVSNVVEWIKGKAENIKDRLTPKNDCKPPSVPEVKVAEPTKAREILNSVGNAAEIFSIRVGGGGDSLFPTNAVQMRDNLPPVVAKSLEGCFSASVVPLGGYVCQYQVDPARTNFLCKAIPANGYTGGVFVVRKDKAIRPDGDITCSSTNAMDRSSVQSHITWGKIKKAVESLMVTDSEPIKAAESAKAKEILESVVNAAEIFSIRVGGGGDSLFPTNAVQMRDNLPPVVAKSIEGCFSSSYPFGDHRYLHPVLPAFPTRRSSALPANGYTGAVFVVRKDMTVKQVDDKVSNFTKSESRKGNQQGEKHEKE